MRLICVPALDQRCPSLHDEAVDQQNTQLGEELSVHQQNDMPVQNNSVYQQIVRMGDESDYYQEISSENNGNDRSDTSFGDDISDNRNVYAADAHPEFYAGNENTNVNYQDTYQDIYVENGDIDQWNRYRDIFIENGDTDQQNVYQDVSVENGDVYQQNIFRNGDVDIWNESRSLIYRMNHEAVQQHSDNQVDRTDSRQPDLAEAYHILTERLREAEHIFQPFTLMQTVSRMFAPQTVNGSEEVIASAEEANRNFNTSIYEEGNQGFTENISTSMPPSSTARSATSGLWLDRPMWRMRPWRFNSRA